MEEIEFSQVPNNSVFHKSFIFSNTLFLKSRINYLENLLDLYFSVWISYQWYKMIILILWSSWLVKFIYNPLQDL